MKTDGKTAIHEMPNDYKPESLGEADDLGPQLSEFFANQIVWSDPAWGIFGCGEFSYEISIAASGPVETFMLHVRGGGDAAASRPTTVASAPSARALPRVQTPPPPN